MQCSCIFKEIRLGSAHCGRMLTGATAPAMTRPTMRTWQRRRVSADPLGLDIKPILKFLRAQKEQREG
jgi:hypothetical protein